MIVNGDVQAFDSGMAVADSAIAGGAHAGTREAAQFLDVEGKRGQSVHMCRNVFSSRSQR